VRTRVEANYFSRLNRQFRFSSSLGMIFSKNRYPLFAIMLWPFRWQPNPPPIAGQATSQI